MFGELAHASSLTDDDRDSSEDGYGQELQRAHHAIIGHPAGVVIHIVIMQGWNLSKF